MINGSIFILQVKVKFDLSTAASRYHGNAPFSMFNNKAKKTFPVLTLYYLSWLITTYDMNYTILKYL